MKEKEQLARDKEGAEEKAREAERYKKWLKDEMMRVLKRWDARRAARRCRTVPCRSMA